MDLNNIIGNLIQQNGGLCALNKLHLPYEHESAGPAAKFGLGCELYLPNIDRTLLRAQAVQFLTDYYQMFPQKVNQFLPRNQRRTVKFKGDPTSQITQDVSKDKPETGYSTSLFGQVDIGLPNDDIEPYQAHVLVCRTDDSDPSFLASTMCICEDGGEDNFGNLLSAVLRWGALCKPLHGSAGLRIIFASGMTQNTTYALPLMKRFPGFSFVSGVDFSRQARTVHNRIKCVDWLTILGDELVSELGGINKMKDALEPHCRIHVYSGGAVIQAGAAPQIGDTQKGDMPEAYRMVANFTKSVRFEDYRSGLFRVPEGLDKKAETLSWIRRFD